MVSQLLERVRLVRQKVEERVDMTVIGSGESKICLIIALTLKAIITDVTSYWAHCLIPEINSSVFPLIVWNVSLISG